MSFLASFKGTVGVSGGLWRRPPPPPPGAKRSQRGAKEGPKRQKSDDEIEPWISSSHFVLCGGLWGALGCAPPPPPGANRDRQTQTDTDRHRQTQTDTDRHRQTPT